MRGGFFAVNLVRIKTCRDLVPDWPVSGHSYVPLLSRKDIQVFHLDLYGKQHIDSNSHAYRMKCTYKSNVSSSPQKYMAWATPYNQARYSLSF